MNKRSILWLAIFCAALAGCNGSGRVLRGVGAPERATQTATVQPPPPEIRSDAALRAAREERLQRGTALNVAPPATGAEPVRLVPAEIPPQPEMAATRDGAIEQIRAKSEGIDEEKPNVFDITPSQVPRLDEARRQRETEQLRRSAEANRNALSEQEAEAKSAAAKSLRYRAQTHYDRALKNIEN